jgi:hypothetical protein
MAVDAKTRLDAEEALMHGTHVAQDARPVDNDQCLERVGQEMGEDVARKIDRAISSNREAQPSRPLVQPWVIRVAISGCAAMLPATKVRPVGAKYERAAQCARRVDYGV